MHATTKFDSRFDGFEVATRRAIAITAFVCAVGSMAHSAFAQGTTSRVSVKSTGGQTAASSGQTGFGSSISSDGRFVAFVSPSNDLASGGGLGVFDVFVHDRATGTTERASVNSSGVGGNQQSFEPSVSDDGRFVAFTSWANSLVFPTIPASAINVYVRDRVNHHTSLESVDSSGTPGNGYSTEPSISSDGHFLAFSSVSSNLVAGDANGWDDVFVRDRISGAVSLVSVDSSGVQGNGASQFCSISADGRYVAFDSLASNLVPNDTNGLWDVFVHDRQTGQTVRASVSTHGVEANDNCGGSRISANGRYVGFSSMADNLVPFDTNGTYDAFEFDLQTGVLTRVSVDSSGAEGDDFSGPPTLSADGRFSAFVSYARNLVVGDLDGNADVFVHDLTTGATTRESLGSTGAEPNADISYAVMSADAGFIAMSSGASNLVVGDTNSASDVFERDRFGCSATVATYCTSGTTTHGCVPTISGSGSPSASAGSGSTINASSVEGQKSGLVFFSVAGPLAKPWQGGSSVLCIKPPTQRTTVQVSGGTANACDGVLSLDWNQYIATHGAFVGGETVWAQVWFRDPPAPGGSSLSNAVWFDVCP